MRPRSRTARRRARQGIVHRDLKPENIFVTPRWTRENSRLRPGETAPRDRVASGADPHRVGDVRRHAGVHRTRAASWATVGSRADLFSLGAILYEMLAGRRAFTGETGADIISAVLQLDPAPLHALSPMADRVLRRCLRKSRTNASNRLVTWFFTSSRCWTRREKCLRAPRLHRCHRHRRHVAGFPGC